MTEVSLVGNIKVIAETKQVLNVDIIGLSSAGAYVRSLNSPIVGDQIVLNLKTEGVVEIKGQVKKQAKNADSQKVFYISFEELDSTQKQAVEQITNYYLKLKKAGVQLEAPFEEGQTFS